MGTGLIPADKGHGPPPRRNAHRLAPDGRWHDPIAARARKNGDRPAPRAHQFREAARGGFLGTFEDYGKLLNALEAEDTAEAREMAIWFTHGAAMILLCLERQVASTGRRVFAELPNQRGVGNAIRRLRYETLPLDETTRLARSVWTF